MKTVPVLFAMTLLSGCATNTVTDPTKDDLPTAVRCMFTKSCDNHIDQQKDTLETEEANNQELAAEQAQAKADLATSEARLAALRAEVSELDQTIARLQAEADVARSKTAEVDPELKDTIAQLEELRAASRDLEFGVLKETVNVADMEAKKAELEDWRDHLERVLEASI